MALDPCVRCGQPTRWPRFPKIRGHVCWTRTGRGLRLLGPLCSLCAGKRDIRERELVLEVEFTSFPERDRIAPKS